MALTLGPLVSGYQAVDRLSENECALIPYVLLAIEAVFLSYYLRINDKGGVIQNARALEWDPRQSLSVRYVMPCLVDESTHRLSQKAC